MTETILLQTIKDRYIQDLIKTSNQYERTDAYSKKYDLLIELKCREKDYDGLILEKEKYETLVKFSGNTRYINSLPNGEIWSWNPKEIQPTFITRLMPATTQFENNTYINKEITYLYRWMGKKIN